MPGRTIVCDYCDFARDAADVMPAGGEEHICRVCAPGTVALYHAAIAERDARYELELLPALLESRGRAAMESP